MGLIGRKVMVTTVNEIICRQGYGYEAYSDE